MVATAAMLTAVGEAVGVNALLRKAFGANKAAAAAPKPAKKINRKTQIEF